MEDNTEKTLAVREIAKLASESTLSIDFNFEKEGLNKDEIYTAMAKNVYEQLDSLPEEQRAAVAMASMSKLLVENFCLGFTLKKELDKQTNE